MRDGVIKRRPAANKGQISALFHRLTRAHELSKCCEYGEAGGGRFSSICLLCAYVSAAARELIQQLQ
jgi:hypothetical protein